ncbi:MAG: hypothetical protein ACRYFK_16615 [Janthinobacterium lividum]
MEARAPYGLPKGPRNLTVPLGQWLRKMGFTVLEQGEPSAPTALEATWRCPAGLLYQVSYAYTPSAGVFQLLAFTSHLATAKDYRGLVHKAEINRLREARFLLTSNVFYAEARRQALKAGTLLPTHAQPAARP